LSFNSSRRFDSVSGTRVLHIFDIFFMPEKEVMHIIPGTIGTVIPATCNFE